MCLFLNAVFCAASRGFLRNSQTATGRSRQPSTPRVYGRNLVRPAFQPTVTSRDSGGLESALQTGNFATLVTRITLLLPIPSRFLLLVGSAGTGTFFSRNECMDRAFFAWTRNLSKLIMIFGG